MSGTHVHGLVVSNLIPQGLNGAIDGQDVICQEPQISAPSVTMSLYFWQKSSHVILSNARRGKPVCLLDLVNEEEVLLPCLEVDAVDHCVTVQRLAYGLGSGWILVRGRGSCGAFGSALLMGGCVQL